MFTPTALMNPTITAFDTNRSTDPSLSNPAATMTTPVSTERVYSAARRVGGVVHGVDVGDDDRHRARSLHRHEGRRGRSVPATVPTM